MINELWDEAFWHELRGAVVLDGWLFSHAGIYPHHWLAGGQTTEDRFARFEKTRAQDFAQIQQASDSAPELFAVGRAGRGTAGSGGPLWLDWNEAFTDALGYLQIG